MNVEASSRVIKTQWNVLTNKYDSIELGDAKANLNTIINDSVSTAVDEAVSDLDIDVGWLDTKAENMFKLIANGVGLHITKDSAGRIILHNEEDISQSKYQYMITAQGFMMSDDYGQDGSWRSGWTTSGDAYMNSLSTITLRALDIYGATINGTVINFGDLADKYITAKAYNNSSDVPQGITFDGSGTVRFRPQTEFLVQNIDANENVFNYFDMHHQSNQNKVNLYNYKYDDTSKSANFISMISNAVNQVFTIGNKNKNVASNPNANQIHMGSFTSSASMTISNNNYNAELSSNSLELRSESTFNRAYLRNYTLDGTYNANEFKMVCSSADGNSISLVNKNNANNIINELQMKSDGTTLLHSASTITIKGDGRIDINSAGSQDLRLISADDIHINPTGFIEVNGIYIYFSGGYVRYTTTRSEAIPTGYSSAS